MCTWALALYVQGECLIFTSNARLRKDSGQFRVTDYAECKGHVKRLMKEIIHGLGRGALVPELSPDDET